MTPHATNDSGVSNDVTKKTQVLHLVGSSTSEFYFSLSVLYARECLTAAYADEKTMNTFEFTFALVHPDDDKKSCVQDAAEGDADLGYSWSFPDDLQESSIISGRKYSKAEGIAKFGSSQPDVVLPHMFCYAGLTHFRTLCSLFDFEFVGPGAQAQEVAENKAWTKAIFQSAGVPVARGERLLLGENDTPTLVDLPFVVKPCCEGNSVGISLCQYENEVREALDLAFSYDDEVLVEQFIPLGKELRIVCVEETDGSISVTPALEYFLPQKIRTVNDKLQIEKEGKGMGFAPTTTQYPADIDQTLMDKLERHSRVAFKALNCRDFAVFDIRVDEKGNPFFLEANLYCSFAPKSAVVWLSSALVDHQELFRKVLTNVAKRGISRKNITRSCKAVKKSMKGKVIAETKI